MTLWNNIWSDLNTEDETINFGKRQVIECKTCIYETNTLASIQADGEVENKPNIEVSLHYTLLCVVIDRFITIFEDETCHKVLLNIAFDSLITSYCITKNEELLYVSLEDGMFFCLYLVGETKILFSINIHSIMMNTTNVMKIAVDHKDEDVMTLILVNERGSIYRITFPSADILIHEVIDYEDKNSQKSFEKGIYCKTELSEITDIEKFHEIAVAPDISNIVLAGNHMCFTWPNENFCNFNNLPFTYTKIQIIKSHNLMLCLRTDNFLNIVCTKTLIGKQAFKDKILDFTLIPNDNGTHSEILLLLQNENENMCNLRLVSFPDFEEKFQIKNLPSTTMLVNTSNSSIRSVLFLEGTITNKYIDTIKIKSVVESEPSFRLERLLRRKQFDEAERFAEKFNLSWENINISKAMLIIEQLSPLTKKTSEETNLDTLINTLNQINNLQFIINCCTNALLKDYKQFKILLLYAKQRIVDSTKNNIDVIQNERLSLLKSVNTVMHRLQTFEILNETLIPNFSSLRESWKEWIHFSRADMFEECNIRLNKEQFEAAAIIWSRHLLEMKKNLTIQTVQNILKTIPNKIPPKVLWNWLSNFIPSLLSLLPTSINDIIYWGCQRIISLEDPQDKNWPQMGIDFATKFLALLKFDKNPLLYFYKESINESSTFQLFMKIVQGLYDIKLLKIDHRIKLSINFYIDDPINLIHVLLDKIPIEGIIEFVNKFLKDYMLKHSLENDQVFSDYIQKVIFNCENSSLEAAPWERKVVIIITFIHDIQNRLNVILKVLKNAPVPWSPILLELAEINTKFEHPLSTKIRSERDYMPIKFILKKYNYTSIGINDKLIFFIIKQNREEMLTDLYELTKNNVLLRKFALSSCINYYLTQGNFDIPFNVLNNLEDDLVLYCCERIINYIISSFTLKDIPESIENYFECLSWIDAKLQEMLAESKIKRFYYMNIVNKMSAVKDLYQIKKEFNIVVPFSDLFTGKDQILKNCIAILSRDMKPQSTFIAYKKAVKLANILKLPRLKVISILLKTTSNFNILKHLTEFEKQNIDITVKECKYVEDICRLTLQSTELNVEIANIIKSLCASALNCCTGCEIECILKYHNLADLCIKSLSKSNSNTSKENFEIVHKSQLKLYTMYNDLATSLQPLFLNILKYTLFIVIKYSNFERMQCQTRTVNKDFIKEQNAIEEILNNVFTTIEEIVISHKEYALFEIIKTLYFSFCFMLRVNENVFKKLKSMLLHSIENLLKRVTNAPRFDLQLSLTCLFLLSDEEAYKLLIDHTKQANISVLAYEYYSLKKNQLMLESIKHYKMLHYWAQRLIPYSITHREIFNSNNEKKREVLIRLMNNDNNNNIIPLLKDFCKSFGFDVDDCLKLYLLILLNTWNPTFKIIYCNGEKELQIPEEEVIKLREKCTIVVNKIIDKNLFKKYVRSILSEINFYHYEAFIILMDLAQIEDNEMRNYFYFLKNYTRCGQPTLIEQEEWVRLHPKYKSLPDIAQYRLPFLPNIEIWNLISSELNLKSYEKWLTVTPIIKVEPHLLCTVAIKEAVLKRWGPLNANKYIMKEWSIYPRDNIFLDKVLKCVKKMGPNALYYATAALYYVVNHTPSGADQVAAIKECYEYAELAIKQSTNFEEGLFEKIRFKYERFIAEHILRTHGLGKDNYISLISYPSNLIHALYMDDSILLRYQNILNLKPDINSAVDSLGHLFKLNLIKLRSQLLQEWLQSDPIKQIEFDQSITDLVSTLTSSDSNKSDDNLCRACYMLQHGDVNLSIHLLIDIGFGENHENNYSSEIRYRALNVLQAITDTTTLQEVTKRDIKTISQYSTTLKYLSKLKALGLGYDVTTFETCSKIELLQMLLHPQYHSRQSLTLITEISLDYDINDYTIWDKVLNEMARLFMVNELMTILPQLSYTSNVTACEGYKSAWQVVIVEPFSKMDIKPSSKQIDACITALCLLYSCPIIHELNFTEILNYCFSIQQPHFAIALLPYLDTVDKQFVLTRIKSFTNVKDIINDLYDLWSKGILSIPYVSNNEYL